MFAVAIETLLLIYLGMTVFVMLGIWLYSHYRAKKAVIYTPDLKLCLCEFCQSTYLYSSEKLVNNCPHCGLYNKNNSYIVD